MNGPKPRSGNALLRVKFPAFPRKSAIPNVWMDREGKEVRKIRVEFANQPTFCLPPSGCPKLKRGLALGARRRRSQGRALSPSPYRTRAQTARAFTSPRGRVTSARAAFALPQRPARTADLLFDSARRVRPAVQLNHAGPHGIRCEPNGSASDVSGRAPRR